MTRLRRRSIEAESSSPFHPPIGDAFGRVRDGLSTTREGGGALGRPLTPVREGSRVTREHGALPGDALAGRRQFLGRYWKAREHHWNEIRTHQKA